MTRDETGVNVKAEILIGMMYFLCKMSLSAPMETLRAVGNDPDLFLFPVVIQ